MRSNIEIWTSARCGSFRPCCCCHDQCSSRLFKPTIGPKPTIAILSLGKPLNVHSSRDGKSWRAFPYSSTLAWFWRSGQRMHHEERNHIFRILASSICWRWFSSVQRGLDRDTRALADAAPSIYLDGATMNEPCVNLNTNLVPLGISDASEHHVNGLGFVFTTSS